MPLTKITDEIPSDFPSSTVRDDLIKSGVISTLQHLIFLINGLPVTQIELKTLSVNPLWTMEQIASSKNDSGNGYTQTPHIALGLPSFVIPNSSFDISLRSYHVYAVQHRAKCIEDDNGNGFVWHTTGSGKMLTSFKASTLLKENDSIQKCVFVADRKDLDRQTREDWSSSDKTSSAGESRRVSAGSANQFNRFQEGCVEENTNTAATKRSSKNSALAKTNLCL
jgi:SWI2/SNF2 ATPase